ncbi:MAG: TolC family outer membrane protein [Kiloniellaceae bacterium]
MSHASNRSRRLRGIAPVLALGVWSACVAPARAQSLTEALAAAYTTNPTLRAARAELRAVNEGVPQALSNWRPDVTVSASGGKQNFETETSFFSAQQNTTPLEAAVTLTQPVYRGGRTIAGTQAAENDVRAQRASLTTVEQSVLLDAATAYMDVWRDQAVIEFNLSNERVIRRQLEATQDRFTVGEVTRTDVAQAETRLAVATADRIAAEGALTASRAAFEEVVGIVPEVLAPPPPLQGLPGTQEDVVALAIARNPDVLAATFAEKAARNRVREVIGELLPSVSLTATASRSEETSQRDSLTKRAQVLAQLTVPLYQQGAVSSRVREAKQISSQRRIEIEARRRRAEQEAVSAWEALLTARAQIRSFESGVRSAEIALEGVRQENLVGARTILDILDAEQELLDARVNLVRSRRDEIVAGFQVLSVIGRLTARDLKLPVAIHDPEIDYRKVRNRWFGLGAPRSQ